MDYEQSTICMATGGALAVQLLNFLELIRLPEQSRPNFKSFIYWLPFIINPLLGAFMGYAYAHSSANINTPLAIHIGISAPLILRGMANVIPPAIR